MADDPCKACEWAERRGEEHECACEEIARQECEKRKPRVRRRYVMRGGELVEVDSVPVRETR
jgi:hypothetical protein